MESIKNFAYSQPWVSYVLVRKQIEGIVVKNRLFFPLFLMIILSNNVFACRYTVREIGYSDIGLKTYRLIFFTDSRTPEEQAIKLSNYSRMLLRDSNVEMEIINADKDESGDAQRFLSKHNIHSFPSAVLVAPNGESILCPYKNEGQMTASSSLALFDLLVSSPIREMIANKLIETYGVILIVEGTDADQNKRARDAAKEIAGAISGNLKQMPKIVNKGPEIVIIPYNKAEAEGILLFSLGITGQNKNTTHIAILYGRGRLAGPVLEGHTINERNIYNLLTLVGADCECGIDNSWIIGETIPLRWGLPQQTGLISQLGFDVENPYVKTEMSQIMSMQAEAGDSLNPLETNLLGFEDANLDLLKSDNSTPRISAAEIQKSFSTSDHQKNGYLKKVFLSLGVVSLLTLMISIFIIYKKHRG